MHRRTKASRSFVLVMIGLVTVGVVGVIAVSSVNGSGMGVGREERTRDVQPMFAYQFEDDRQLIGYASDVFLGRVTAQVGSQGIGSSIPGDVIPQTQFSVEVQTVIKGQPPAVVTVSQGSGVDSDTGETVLINGDPLLQPGETVLFATNHEPDRGWYTIVGGGFGAARASSAGDAAALVTRFQQAAVNAFVPQPIPGYVPEHAGAAE